jgi:Skp family chaperone for outer membrane proteins
MPFTPPVLLATIRPAILGRVGSRDAWPFEFMHSIMAVYVPGTSRQVMTTTPTARSADVRMLFNRKQIQLITAAAVTFATFGYLYAQAPHPLGANASKYHIAVVDISAIFKRHARFKTAMDGMKAEMEKIEAELKADRERIAQAEQHRNTFGPGTPDYKTADENVARMMAEFNLKMGKLRKDFLEREAKVYYQTYLEVVSTVNDYAKRQGIGLVLRFNGEPIDPNRRDDVLREINKPVVMQDNIDITGDILMLLNRDQMRLQQGGAPTQAVRPTQIPR